jgi:predicted PurR-regulated permease PerM
MGGKLELHPLAALFAILAGGEIAGVIGVYLSIPIMATLRILWRRWQHYGVGTDLSQQSSVTSDKPH